MDLAQTSCSPCSGSRDFPDPDRPPTRGSPTPSPVYGSVGSPEVRRGVVEDSKVRGYHPPPPTTRQRDGENHKDLSFLSFGCPSVWNCRLSLLLRVPVPPSSGPLRNEGCLRPVSLTTTHHQEDEWFQPRGLSYRFPTDFSTLPTSEGNESGSPTTRGLKGLRSKDRGMNEREPRGVGEDL